MGTKFLTFGGVTSMEKEKRCSFGELGASMWTYDF